MSETPEEKRERLRVTQNERRARRRAQGLCLECEEPRTHGTRCERHYQRALDTARAWRSSPKGRARDRAWKRRQYRKLKRKGLCQGRCGKPAEPGRARCADCALAQKIAHQLYLDRRDGLAPPIERVRYDVDRPINEPVNDYRDGECKLKDAVARFIELHNGITSQAITEAFMPDDRERDIISHVLSRGAREGRFRVEPSSEGRLYFPVRAKRAA